MSSAELWGGPEDGEHVWVPKVLPELIGVHRLADGALVPIRDQRQLALHRDHVSVYTLDGDAHDPSGRPRYRWRNGRPSGQEEA